MVLLRCQTLTYCTSPKLIVILLDPRFLPLHPLVVQAVVALVPLAVLR